MKWSPSARILLPLDKHGDNIESVRKKQSTTLIDKQVDDDRANNTVAKSDDVGHNRSRGENRDESKL